MRERLVLHQRLWSSQKEWWGRGGLEGGSAEQKIQVLHSLKLSCMQGSGLKDSYWSARIIWKDKRHDDILFCTHSESDNWIQNCLCIVPNISISESGCTRCIYVRIYFPTAEVCPLLVCMFILSSIQGTWNMMLPHFVQHLRPAMHWAASLWLNISSTIAPEFAEPHQNLKVHGCSMQWIKNSHNIANKQRHPNLNIFLPQHHTTW